MPHFLRCTSGAQRRHTIPYDSVMIRMQEKFDRKDDKKYSLEYYRRMGIAMKTRMERTITWWFWNGRNVDGDGK